MRIPLNGGAYQAKSIIANAQSCVNLYQEINQKDSPVPVTHYLTPGLDLLISGPTGVVRCTYRATNGDLYRVVNQNIYYVNSSFTETLVGTLAFVATTPVSMADNGLAIVVVDGSTTGYAINMTTRAFGTITDPSFYGADKVDFLDTFFIFNRPSTNQFYISLSNASYEMLTDLHGVTAGSIASPGESYADGTYTSVALNGGTGTGAQATITVLSGAITEVDLSAPGIDYTLQDMLTVSDIRFLNEKAVIAGTIVGGSSYTNGTYTNIALTGGSGTGAIADITISGGAATTVSIDIGGTNYVVGDVLTAPAASIGGTGSGFTYTVSSVGGTGFGFVYTVTAVNGTSFDPLDIAAKNSYADDIQTLIVMNRQLWLLGLLTAEIWYDAGGEDFAFQETPGVFIEHGCVAKYSVAKQDLTVYWLSQNLQGQTIVLKGNAYLAIRISTHAIENEFSTYSTISDAIGFTYQQEGHAFYVLTFPTANKTWVCDQSTELWHERAWTDNNGNLNRHRANCVANAYGMNVVGDWQNGNLYKFNLNTFTDVGQPISRIRSFPHIENNGNRISYQSFTADMAVGNSTLDVSAAPPSVSLRWSDDRGASYGNKLEQSLGAAGQYLTSVQWNRLGLARDRVFELSWSENCQTALNGAWIEMQEASS